LISPTSVVTNIQTALHVQRETEMTHTSIALRLAATGTLAALLTGCQIAGPVTTMPAPEPIKATGPTGNWIGTDGVAISTFGGGLFNSFAADTGAQLARGTYTVTGTTLVELTLTSLVRGTTSRVNCLVVNASQMNCTAASGAQFSLNRTDRIPPAVMAPVAGAVASGPLPQG
jgi:hypothetical protein